MTVWYEWAIEKTDAHTGDIADVDHADTYAEAKQRAGHDPGPGFTNAIALTRIVGNEADGMTDRQYAYVQAGKLPSTFEDGRAIPKRFHNELS